MSTVLILGILGIIGIAGTGIILSQKPQAQPAPPFVPLPKARPRDYSPQQNMVLNFS